MKNKFQIILFLLFCTLSWSQVKFEAELSKNKLGVNENLDILFTHFLALFKECCINSISTPLSNLYEESYKAEERAIIVKRILGSKERVGS